VVALPSVADMLSFSSLAGLEPPGFGSFSHRYGSSDPDSYQNVTDPQHGVLEMSGFRLGELLYFVNNDGWGIFIEKYRTITL
jgi:hypothetical protein